MRRLLVVIVLVLTACGSTAEVSTEAPASAESAAPEGELRGSDEIRDVLAEMQATFETAGPARYVLVSSEICPSCDVVQRETAVIDGVPFALSRDSDGLTMLDAIAELRRTLGHEQYDEHVARFDASTGALEMWSARFSPVGGSPDTTGDTHRLEPFEDDVVPADVSDCDLDGWQTAGASGFGLLLPPELEDRSAEGVDSEIAEWRSDDFVVTWDYGWYSEPVHGANSVRTFVAHDAHVGMHSDRGQRLAVYVPRISLEGGEWNALTLLIEHSTADAATARCIAHSIDIP